MPSKNSINRPKQKVNLNRKIHQRAAKRDAMERKGLLAPARSSELSKSGQLKSVPLDLYKGERLSQGPTTTHTLSKKRAKKIERNLKYVEQRKLLLDLQSQSEQNGGMQIDAVSSTKKEKVAKKGQLEKMREAISGVLEDIQSQGLTLHTEAGTTLGGQYFI
ncbi:ribosome biogenesis protein ALB1 [Kluyveromyces marxianus]|uniref:Ribosome biogenesis protein ALB1 n=1 Tax=Kluyveromyces marxianus TaxID=4911 RepID=A0ABX6F5A7_KLUMA|nr:ribosome biogenesis protein ALB1 [Kluyveromyces marxianus]BAP72768.1 ribosome biogenesis protein ALB1 [Kluyveromyces marxianus]